MAVFFNIKDYIQNSINVNGQIQRYATFQDLPTVDVQDGALAVVLSEDVIYLFDGETGKWTNTGVSDDGGLTIEMASGMFAPKVETAQQIEAIVTRVAANETSIVKIEANIDAIEGDIETVNADIDAIEENIAKFKAENLEGHNQLQANINSLNTLIEAVYAKKEEVNAQIEGVREHIESLPHLSKEDLDKIYTSIEDTAALSEHLEAMIEELTLAPGGLTLAHAMRVFATVNHTHSEYSLVGHTHQEINDLQVQLNAEVQRLNGVLGTLQESITKLNYITPEEVNLLLAGYALVDHTHEAEFKRLTALEEEVAGLGDIITGDINVQLQDFAKKTEVAEEVTKLEAKDAELVAKDGELEGKIEALEGKDVELLANIETRLTEEQANLKYASLFHNHDEQYAPKEHNHDTVYSKLGHTHAEFAELDSKIQAIDFSHKADKTEVEAIKTALEGKDAELNTAIEGLQASKLDVAVAEERFAALQTKADALAEHKVLEEKINSLRGAMNFKGTVDTKAQLDALEGAVKGDTYIVLVDETKEGAKSQYTHNGEGFVYLGGYDFVIKHLEINDEVATSETVYSSVKTEAVVDTKVTAAKEELNSALAETTATVNAKIDAVDVAKENVIEELDVLPENPADFVGKKVIVNNRLYRTVGMPDGVEPLVDLSKATQSAPVIGNYEVIWSTTGTSSNYTPGKAFQSLSYWSSKDNCTTENPQWFGIKKLDEATFFKGMNLKFESTTPNDFEIQVSKDNETWETAFKGNGPELGFPLKSTGGTCPTVYFKPVKAKAIRLVVFNHKNASGEVLETQPLKITKIDFITGGFDWEMLYNDVFVEKMNNRFEVELELAADYKPETMNAFVKVPMVAFTDTHGAWDVTENQMAIAEDGYYQLAGGQWLYNMPKDRLAVWGYVLNGVNHFVYEGTGTNYTAASTGNATSLPLVISAEKSLKLKKGDVLSFFIHVDGTDSTFLRKSEFTTLRLTRMY